MATCPECDAEIVIDDDDLEDMEAGDPWDCDACGSRLRVSSLDPLEFEGDDDEDADDDDDDDEDAADDDTEEADDDLDDDFDDDDDGDADDKEDWDE
jgi:lysine biosynthesis protein LysW